MNPYASPPTPTEPIAEPAARSRPVLRWRLFAAFLSWTFAAALLATLPMAGLFLFSVWGLDPSSNLYPTADFSWVWEILAINLAIGVTQGFAGERWLRGRWVGAALLNLAGFALLYCSNALIAHHS